MRVIDKSMSKAVIVINENFLYSSATNSKDLNNMVELLNNNYLILWMHTCNFLPNDKLKIFHSFTFSNNGTRSMSKIKYQFRKNSSVLSCPFIVIDFPCNETLYEGYDFYINLDNSKISHNRLSYVSIDMSIICEELNYIITDWYGVETDYDAFLKKFIDVKNNNLDRIKNSMNDYSIVQIQNVRKIENRETPYRTNFNENLPTQVNVDMKKEIVVPSKGDSNVKRKRNNAKKYKYKKRKYRKSETTNPSDSDTSDYSDSSSDLSHNNKRR